MAVCLKCGNTRLTKRPDGRKSCKRCGPKTFATKREGKNDDKR